MVPVIFTMLNWRTTRGLRAQKKTPCCSWAIFVLCLVPVLFAGKSQAQDLARRLILKDGSYQMVTQYEVKGDRVRYKSAERDEWEELPASLVDWPATEKYQKDRATSAIPEASALDKETDAERAEEESHMPQVAPGLRIPEDTGIFLLDNFQGQPQLVELQQSEGDVKSGSKADILRGAIVPIPAKQSIELEGEHATIHVHVPVPSIYINMEDETPVPPEGQTASAKQTLPSLDAPRKEQDTTQQPQQPEKALVPYDRFRIVRVKVKGGKRIVGDLRRSASGKTSPDQNSVKATIDRFTGGWLKLTPMEDMPPGEYALIELQGREGMNLYVWDFGVDPKGPANANPWKPK